MTKCITRTAAMAARAAGIVIMTGSLSVALTAGSAALPPDNATSRKFTLRGMSLNMPEDVIVADLVRRTSMTPETYEFPTHRSTHLGSADCGWKRIDVAPACLHFGVLSTKVDDIYKTTALELDQRFEIPISIEGVRDKLVERYGEPDYADEPKQYRFLEMHSWTGGTYLWSDALSGTDEKVLSEFKNELNFASSVGGEGVWLRARLNVTGHGQVIGISVELVDQTLNDYRHELQDAAWRMEQAERAADSLTQFQLD